MATTVHELFSNQGISRYTPVKWSDIKRLQANNLEGVYVVSMSDDPRSNDNISDIPAFNDSAIQQWIRKADNLQIDTELTTIKTLKNRLAEFWIPNESILYIGKAPLRKNNKGGIISRLKEYYRTPIGAKSPHAGGFWIKMLSTLENFTVYYAECESPTQTEFQMLAYFMENVDKTLLKKDNLKELPLPFANIRFQTDKRHGLKKQTK